MTSPIGGYTETLLDHFENPRNVGALDHPDATGFAGNAACGDELVLTMRIEDGVIREARFQASGCTASIASSSMATVMLTGLTLAQAGALNNRDVAGKLGGLPETKLHCSVLAEEAVRSALDDFKARQS